MSSIPGYLTLTEAAAALGVSHSQCSRYVAKKLLEAVSIGNQKLVKEESLDGFEKPPVGNPAFTQKTGRKKKK